MCLLNLISTHASFIAMCTTLTHLQSHLLYLKLFHSTSIAVHIFVVVDHHHVVLLHDGLVILGCEGMNSVFAIILGDLQALLPPRQASQREEDTQKHPTPLHAFCRRLAAQTPLLEGLLNVERFKNKPICLFCCPK